MTFTLQLVVIRKSRHDHYVSSSHNYHRIECPNNMLHSFSQSNFGFFFIKLFKC